MAVARLSCLAKAAGLITAGTDFDNAQYGSSTFVRNMLFNTYDFDNSTDRFLSDQFDASNIIKFALYIPRQFFIYNT